MGFSSRIYTYTYIYIYIYIYYDGDDDDDLIYLIWLVVFRHASEKYEFVKWAYYSQYMESH